MCSSNLRSVAGAVVSTAAKSANLGVNHPSFTAARVPISCTTAGMQQDVTPPASLDDPQFGGWGTRRRSDERLVWIQNGDDYWTRQ